MNEAPSPRQRPSNSLPALAGAATLAASIVALWGIMSALMDRDVIDVPDAGPLLGPLQVVTAAVVAFLAVRGILPTAPRTPSRTTATVLGGAFAALAVSYLAMILAGALGYLLVSARVATVASTAGHFALSPFVFGAAVLTGLAVGVTGGLISFDRRSR